MERITPNHLRLLIFSGAGMVMAIVPCAAGQPASNCLFEPEHVIALNADDAFSVLAVDLDGGLDLDGVSGSFGDDKIAWYENDGGPPTCDANGAYAAECDGATTSVSLDGSGSGDALTYAWDSDCPGFEFDDSTSATPTLTLDSGLGDVSCNVFLTVDDGIESDSCESTVTVTDTTRPTIRTHGLVRLWPPNHKKHVLSLSDCAVLEDACAGPLDLDLAGTIVSISSDEPENAKGVGDGNTTDDIVITGPSSFILRAERQGGGNGRIYTVRFTARDSEGHMNRDACRFGVPLNQSGARPVNDGAAAGYTVYAP